MKWKHQKLYHKPVGHGVDVKKVIEPKEIVLPSTTFSNSTNCITNITTGSTYSIISCWNETKKTHQFYGCGDNKDAQLIIGNGRILEVEEIQLLESPALESIQGLRIKQFTSGTYHNACLFDDGTVLMWGTSNSGQVGNPVYNRVQFDPFNSEILKSLNIEKLSLGSTFTMALSKDGKLYSFGSATFNELGNGDTFTERIPKKIENELINKHKIVDVEAGFFHSIALTDSNQVLCWGRNQESQCFPVPERSGRGMYTDVLYLDTKEEIGNEKIIQIASNSFTSYILTESGNVYSIGANDYGQLGVGKQFKLGKLNKVNIGNVKKIYTRFRTVIVETNDNLFYGWGNNFDRQLSIDSRAVVYEPTLLDKINQLNRLSGGSGGIIDLSISSSHCLALIK
eukprot:gene5521-6879_t